jgi:hypothetical protein
MDKVMIGIVQMQQYSSWRPTHIHNGSGNPCHRGCVVEEMLSKYLRVSTWKSALAYHTAVYQAYGTVKCMSLQKSLYVCSFAVSVRPYL